MRQRESTLTLIYFQPQLSQDAGKIFYLHLSFVSVAYNVFKNNAAEVEASMLYFSYSVCVTFASKSKTTTIKYQTDKRTKWFKPVTLLQTSGSKIRAGANESRFKGSRVAEFNL